MDSITLENRVNAFLDTIPNESTRHWYRKYLRPMAAYFGKDRPVSEVTPNDAARFMRHLRQRNTCWESHPHRPSEHRRLSDTTLDNYLRAMKAFWNDMLDQGLVSVNPFKRLKPIRENLLPEMKAISPNNLSMIRAEGEKSGPRDNALIDVLATTGLRAGELASMSLRQLHLEQGYAYVKGKTGWRKLILGETATMAIRRYLEIRPNVRTDSLWLNIRGEPLTTDGIRQMVNRLAKRAGVEGRHNLHAFRHRVAQSWLEGGKNHDLVAMRLGHKDVKVTLAIYGNQNEPHLRQAIEEAEDWPFRTHLFSTNEAESQSPDKTSEPGDDNAPHNGSSGLASDDEPSTG